MIAVLAAAALIWFGGALAGLSADRRRWAVVGLVAVVFLSHLILPEGHALRALTGGKAGPWGLVLGLGAVVAGYVRLLRHLRARAGSALPEVAPAPPPPPPAGSFSEAELHRYARHIYLREIGGPGRGGCSRRASWSSARAAWVRLC